MKIIILLVFFSACSNNFIKSKSGDCIKHKFEAGVYKIKKRTNNQIVAQKVDKNGILGKIKVIGPLYGGWIPTDCPVN